MAAFLSSGAAFAQSAVVTTGTATDAITIEPEYRTRIHSYVTENHIAPITTRERLAVGATLPGDVELRNVPSDWGPGLNRYRYVYSGNNVILVEPSTRRVVKVID